jgi:hypothetical protein
VARHLMQLRASHRVAGRADGLAKVDDGVAVAVREDTRHVDVVPGGLPLAPARPPGPAVERGQPVLAASSRSCQGSWLGMLSNHATDAGAVAVHPV